MASLDSLPPDQRAVPQLVLQRGRTYDQIAELLSIDRAAVRQRALAAFDELGPQTGVPAEQRALITDYLLGQLPARVGETTRDRLADSPPERAWARVVASELAPLAADPLPEIPVERGRDREPAPAPAAQAASHTAPPSAPTPRSSRRERSREDEFGREPASARRSSRTGGAILLGLIALVAIVVAIVLIASGGSSKHNTTTSAASPTTTAAGTTTTATTSGGTPQIVGQINLSAPLSSSKAKGAAFVLKRGTTTAIVVQGQSVPPNTKHDAYAVWLYNTPTDSHRLGFVTPGVGSNGKLSTAGALPSNAGHYKQLLVTRETSQNPARPGTIVLQGALTGV
jgi:hypothetical protein